MCLQRMEQQIVHVQVLPKQRDLVVLLEHTLKMMDVGKVQSTKSVKKVLRVRNQRVIVILMNVMIATLLICAIQIVLQRSFNSKLKYHKHEKNYLHWFCNKPIDSCNSSSCNSNFGVLG